MICRAWWNWALINDIPCSKLAPSSTRTKESSGGRDVQSWEKDPVPQTSWQEAVIVARWFSWLLIAGKLEIQSEVHTAGRICRTWPAKATPNGAHHARGRCWVIKPSLLAAFGFVNWASLFSMWRQWQCLPFKDEIPSKQSENITTKQTINWTASAWFIYSCFLWACPCQSYALKQKM